MKTIFFLLIALLLFGCASEPSRYKLKNDKAPVGKFDFSQVPDAVPKWEPLSKGGNRSPYKVNGKRYTIMDSAVGYQEVGVASWYGVKFHGELTSNGETYNMYEMSAAHKSLPLPTYLRVTNLENKRSIVVRVNDRGPFHGDRLIDLSFAAANRLGFADKGTARVKLEAITPPAPKAAIKQVSVPVTQSVSSSVESQTVVQDKLAPFVQIAAYSNESAAVSLKAQLEAEYSRNDVFIASAQKSGKLIHRVRVGPFKSTEQAKQFRRLMESKQVGSPIVISRSILGKGQ